MISTKPKLNIFHNIKNKNKENHEFSKLKQVLIKEKIWFFLIEKVQ
jgi:hypothetical protein